MTETTTVKGKGLAIAGMVVGIVAFIISFFSIGLILGIVGAVLSAIGLAQLSKSNGPKGMAITGLILSVLAIAISIYMAIQIAAALKDFGGEFQNQLENVDWEAEMNDALNDVEDEDAH